MRYIRYDWYSYTAPHLSDAILPPQSLEASYINSQQGFAILALVALALQFQQVITIGAGMQLSVGKGVLHGLTIRVASHREGLDEASVRNHIGCDPCCYHFTKGVLCARHIPITGTDIDEGVVCRAVRSYARRPHLVEYLCRVTQRTGES